VNGGIAADMRALAIGVLERRGGLVEWSERESAGVAILDGPTAELLGTAGDTVRLSEQPGEGGLYLNLAGDFLETMQRLLDSQPRVARLRLPEAYLKSQGFDEAVARSFKWLNAKVAVGASEPRAVEYHTWWFRALLASDDRWEACFYLTVNAASGAEVEFPDPLALWEVQPAPAAADAPETLDIAADLAQARAMQAAGEFLARMDARLERDRRRLKEYYGALLRQSDQPSHRRYEPPDPDKAAAKKRAVQLELRRKLEELDARFAVRATLRPVALVRTEVMTRMLSIVVQRKQARRQHTLYWNPLVKQLEPLVCSCCHRATWSVAFTNDDVAPQCAACAGRV